MALKNPSTRHLRPKLHDCCLLQGMRCLCYRRCCQIPLPVEHGFSKDFIKATSPLCPLAFFHCQHCTRFFFLEPFANQMHYATEYTHVYNAMICHHYVSEILYLNHLSNFCCCSMFGSRVFEGAFLCTFDTESCPPIRSAVDLHRWKLSSEVRQSFVGRIRTGWDYSGK